MKPLRFFFRRGREGTAGFTLVESLVVIAITAMLTGIFIGYTRSSNNQLALAENEVRLIGTFNRARSLALQKLNVPEACAFGIAIPPLPTNEFILFQDTVPAGNTCRDYGTGVSGYLSYDVGEEIERVILDDGFEFTEIQENKNGLTILFVPPELEVITSGRFPITLTIGGRSVSGTVTISASGQVTTQ